MNISTDSNNSGNRPIVETRSISKAFGHVQALKEVDFEIFSSEVLALVGDNGAGKSTLIKVLSGALVKDEGQIIIDGQPVEIESVTDAQKYGISTVYQDLALVDVRDVASNIFLGREPLKLGLFIDKEKMIEDSKEVLNNLKIKIPDEALSFEEVLTFLEKETNLSFELINNNFIVIREKKFLKAICGYIKEYGSEFSLSYATVQGSDNSVVTNDQGYFQLEVTNPDEELVIKYLGYKEQRIKVNEFPEEECLTIYQRI